MRSLVQQSVLNDPTCEARYIGNVLNVLPKKPLTGTLGMHSTTLPAKPLTGTAEMYSMALRETPCTLYSMTPPERPCTTECTR